MAAPRKSISARARDLTLALIESDVESYWPFHEVVFNKDDLGRSPSVSLESDSITVHVPYTLSRVPYNIMEDLFVMMIDAIKGKGRLSDMPDSLKQYLESTEGKRDVQQIYKELGIIAEHSKMGDDWNNTLRAAVRSIVKMSFHKREIREMKFKWANSKKKGIGYAALGLPYGRIIVLNESLGSGITPELIYAVYHEICYVLAYSVERDRLNKRHFRQLISEYPGWQVMEQSCIAKGFRFKHSPTISKKGDRW